MKENSRLELIKSPFFLVGLALLLLNDFYLKYEFSNVLTGKLSDIAGIFIFPFFFSSLFPKRSLHIYFLTAGLFIYWSSDLSQNLINVFNGFGIGINRTIDYTDFFTLAILPFSYSYFNSQLIRKQLRTTFSTLLISSVAIFSFFATTLPRQKAEIKIRTQKTYVLDAEKAEFFSLISAAHGYSDSLQLNLRDSLFYLYYYIPELRVDMTVLAKIKTIENDKTEIQLENFVEWYLTGSLFTGIDDDEFQDLNQLNQQEHERYFETFFLNAFKESPESARLYYDNQRIHDERRNDYE